MSEWISVKDKYPETGERVQVVRRDPKTKRRWIAITSHYDGNWEWIDKQSEGEVTHWKPLDDLPPEKKPSLMSEGIKDVAYGVWIDGDEQPGRWLKDEHGRLPWVGDELGAFRLAGALRPAYRQARYTPQKMDLDKRS